MLSLKEVLHFRGERNQGPQPENVVYVNTKPVVTDEITACFRLWYRYPGTQTLLGPDLGATTFWFEINTGTGWVWFGNIFRRFVWSEAKPLKWYSVCFTADIQKHLLTLVIDGQLINLGPANELNPESGVQLPSQFNQGLYSSKGQETDYFFGKLTDLTLSTVQSSTEEMMAFTSGCDSLTDKKGKKDPDIKSLLPKASNKQNNVLIKYQPQG